MLAQCPLTQPEISALFQALMGVSKWIFIYYTWRPNLKDEADNHLIELAVAGNAEIIATNNVKDLRNSELLFPDLMILKPEDVLRR
jgi:predicted nucleic acid-binding protein